MTTGRPVAEAVLNESASIEENRIMTARALHLNRPDRGFPDRADGQ